MRAIVRLVALLLAATLTPDAGAAPASAVTTRIAHRAYGDGPVRIGKASVLKVRFEGRKGDRVRLGGALCPVSLRGPDGDRVARLPEGFWKLTGRGRQTFTFTGCDRQFAKTMQLEKLKVSRMAVDSLEGTRLRAQRGFVDAVRVTVPATGRLRLTSSDVAAPQAEFVGLVLPGGEWYPLRNGRNYYGTMYFEDGRRITTPYGALRGAGGGGVLVPHAGDRVTVIASRSAMTVWQSVAQTVVTSIDAPAISLPPSAVPFRDYEVGFDAVAGSWLHAEVLGPEGNAWSGVRLIDSKGNYVGRHIPLTGRYRLVVPTDLTTATAQVRIRTIRVLDTTMPVDGTPLTYSTTQPGEWVLAPMDLAETRLYRLFVSSSSTSGDWQAIATGQAGIRCGNQSGNGCGDWSYGTVSNTRPESLETFGFASGQTNPWMVMFQPAPATSGTVQLSVKPLS